MLAGLVFVIVASASWGTWSLFLRPAHLPPALTTPLIFLMQGLCSLPLALRGPRTAWSRAVVGLICLNAAFDALNVLLYFAAIDTTTVAIAVLTHYLAPILVALAAPRIDRVRVPGAVPAALVALVGLAIVLEPWRAPAAGAITGALLGAGSAVCYAGNVFTVRRLASKIGAARATSYHSLVAAVATLPLLLTVPGALSHASLGSVGLVALAGATIGAAAGVLYVTGLVRVGAARAGVLAYCEPLVAVIVGALVWDEPLHAPAILGGALVLAAGVHVAHAGSRAR